MIWIKICGLTTPAAVNAAREAGADAIGFVFSPSPRRISAAAARLLAEPARGRLTCTAVMRHPSQAEVDEVLEVFTPDLLQTDHEDLQRLQLPPGLPMLPVFRKLADEAMMLPRRILFEAADSGAGVRADWSAARRLAEQVQVILAGGLNETNIAAALRQVRPFGVDVSSGVEERPGLKSPAAIARFIAAARSTAAAAAREFT